MLRRVVMTTLCCVAWTATPADAEVLVHGGEDSVVVQASDASIAEVASRLQSALKINVTVIGTLSRPITGLYSGPVRRVLSRILAGTNFVVNSGASGIDIVILGNNGAAGNRPSARGGPQAYSVAANDAVSEQQGWNGTFAKPRPPKDAPPQDAKASEADGTADTAAAVVSSDVEPAADSPQGWNGTGGWKIPAPAQRAAKPVSALPQDSEAPGAGGSTDAAAAAANSNVEPAGDGPQGWNGAGGWKIPAPAQRDAKPVSAPSPQAAPSPQGQSAAPPAPNQSLAVMRALALVPKGMRHANSDEDDAQPGSTMGRPNVMGPGGALQHLQDLRSSDHSKQELSPDHSK